MFSEVLETSSGYLVLEANTGYVEMLEVGTVYLDVPEMDL